MARKMLAQAQMSANQVQRTVSRAESFERLGATIYYRLLEVNASGTPDITSYNGDKKLSGPALRCLLTALKEIQGF